MKKLKYKFKKKRNGIIVVINLMEEFSRYFEPFNLKK